MEIYTIIFLHLIIQKKIRTYSGDIDIFFENENQIKYVISSKEQYAYLDCLRLTPSLTNICLNITYDASSMLNNKIHGALKIQLVSGFYGKAEDIMETFDFTNSRCAIDSQFVYCDERFFDLEKNNTLDVSVGNGPLTGYRILKYLNKRGLTSITNSSRDAITEWSIRYGGEFWDDHPMSKVKGLSSKSTISRLIKDDRIFLTTDLLNLIGTVQVRQPVYSDGRTDNYSIIGWNESDLATDIIAQRSNK